MPSPTPNRPTPALVSRDSGSAAAQRGLIALAVACLAFAALALSRQTLAPLMRAYLFSFVFFLALSLGSLLLVIVQNLAPAWARFVPRRLVESLALLLPVCLLLFIPLLGWLPYLYPWANPRLLNAISLPPALSIYFSLPLFILRALFCFAAWIALALALCRPSVPSVAVSPSPRRLSVFGLLILAATIPLAAFDWLLSLPGGPLYATGFPLPHQPVLPHAIFLFAGMAALYAALASLVAQRRQR